MITTSSGLQYEDVDSTDGPIVMQGQQVRLNYKVALRMDDLIHENETQWIDSSERHKEPVIVVVGKGEVIAGVDEALIGMRRGATRILIVPPNLAFGNRGVPSAIPPNSTLYIELIVSTKI